MTVHVLLVDDQDMVRAALRAVIDRRDGLHVVGDAADGESGVADAWRLRPDVVVMDVRLPGMTGVEATRRILTDWPHPGPPPRVLMLTTFDLDEYVHAALRAGAAGFLLKNSPPDQLAHAIRVVADGESMLAPSVTKRLIDAFSALPPGVVDGAPRATPRLPGPLGRLSERELQVFVHVARGLSNAQIAAELGLTEANVKSRINRAFTKLGLVNRVQAAILAHEAGLVPAAHGSRPPGERTARKPDDRERRRPDPEPAPNRYTD
ncbi:DNA-binding response regulator [Actinomadura spongiicola]|uniref:DNA-binding response regulator n=1 Tax=Actinomadura spongiicola TaxID=2303421 RepID=A0A372GEK0_9ACTN|nr:response regulator transcription factor [Actinomadura spongiicola]RFS83483.1 DNA-binding response regulator [Actinomadura spongiicola]